MLAKTSHVGKVHSTCGTSNLISRLEWLQRTGLGHFVGHLEQSVADLSRALKLELLVHSLSVGIGIDLLKLLLSAILNYLK